MPKIEHFYAGYSAFAYLGHAEFMRIAKSAGREVDHRPFDLRKVLTTTGATPFVNRTQAHKDYFFGTEIRRWAEYRKIPVLRHTPTHHGNDITLSNCMLIAGLVKGMNIDALAQEMLRAHWMDDYDLDNRNDLVKIGRNAGIDAQPLLDAASSTGVLGIYAKNTEEAINRSVFGSPTYFIDGDMFYGQDHLELIARRRGV
jgi:2-hydroxychromene-2-carboxylate isomerase